MNAFKTSREDPNVNRRVLPGVVAGALRNSVADPRDLREGLLRNVWTELKRFSARNVRTIEMGRIRGIHRVTVEGPVVRHGTLIVSALAAVLECERIFEFGTSDGETSRRRSIVRSITSPERVSPCTAVGTSSQARATLELPLVYPCTRSPACMLCNHTKTQGGAASARPWQVVGAKSQ